MTALPSKYAWLAREPGPKMLLEAVALFGTREFVGPRHNPVILDWAKEIGEPGYTSDETPGAASSSASAPIAPAGRRGRRATPSGRATGPHGAPERIGRCWATCLLFPRGAGGHVALYVGEDPRRFHILGGSQGNEVSIILKEKAPLIACRRAPWRVSQPANVRPVLLSADGTPSGVSEA
jgi:hypothetical protein